MHRNLGTESEREGEVKKTERSWHSGKFAWKGEGGRDRCSFTETVSGCQESCMKTFEMCKNIKLDWSFSE